MLPNRGICNRRSHPEPLEGVQADGQFATARAKQYPPAMCKVLANAMATDVCRYGLHRIPDSPELPEALERFWMPLDP